MTLREQTERWLQAAHQNTALGRATVTRRQENVGPGPAQAADVMAFLTDMVLALEDIVRVLAEAIDRLAAGAGESRTPGDST